jgi:hypothetical protein
VNLAHRDVAHSAVWRRVAFVVDTANGAPLRYRVQTPLSGLEQLGIDAQVLDAADPGLAGRAAGADAVIVFRVPVTRTLARALRRIREENPRSVVAFDIDDALFDVQNGGFTGDMEELAHRFAATVVLCGRALGSTATIADLATRQIGAPAIPFRNGLHPVVMGLSRRAPPRLAMFDGSGTHRTSLEHLAPVISDVLTAQEHRRVQFWAFGASSIPEPLQTLGNRVHRVPFMDWTQLPGWMRQMDVALAPNSDDVPIADTKSALKWLEAGAVGVPVIARATQPYREAITDGVDGALVSSMAHDEWGEAIDRLVSRRSDRRRIGRAAARTISARDCVVVAEELLDALSGLREIDPVDAHVDVESLPADGVPLASVPTGSPSRSRAPLGRRAQFGALRGGAASSRCRA